MISDIAGFAFPFLIDPATGSVASVGKSGRAGSCGRGGKAGSAGRPGMTGIGRLIVGREGKAQLLISAPCAS